MFKYILARLCLRQRRRLPDKVNFNLFYSNWLLCWRTWKILISNLDDIEEYSNRLVMWFKEKIQDTCTDGNSCTDEKTSLKENSLTRIPNGSSQPTRAKWQQYVKRFKGQSPGIATAAPVNRHCILFLIIHALIRFHISYCFGSLFPFSKCVWQITFFSPMVSYP